jgi:hypothetical protein
MPPEPFRFQDCALIILSLGRTAHGLRELRDRAAEVPPQSIWHHFYETLLRPTFDDPEYRNDFALWARRGLRDHVLAERLAVIDPLEYDSLERLREHLVDVLDDRLAEAASPPAVRQGQEFHFLRSQMIVVDTGLRAATPGEMAAHIPALPPGSIFFHFIEGRRRPGQREDDFSAWLRLWGQGVDGLRERLGAIDFRLWPLPDLRRLVGAALAGRPAVEGIR